MSAPLSADAFLLDLQRELGRPVQSAALCVGFSGGVDSTVLLYLCKTLRDRGAVGSLRAVHVDHGLSDLSGDWALHAQAMCRDWQIPLSSLQVDCDTKGNVEEGAREGRYQVFEQELAENECLLQAHHRDDQVETLLYRLIRGAGVAGMCGIPRQRPLGKGLLLRPMLDYSRTQIESYARQHGLRWVEDDSNTNTRFDRNYLRLKVVPELQARWPGSSNNISRFSQVCREAEDVLSEVAASDSAQCISSLLLPGLGSVAGLDVNKLLALSVARQNLLLRHWLDEQGVPVLPRDLLRQVVSEVALAQDGGEPLLSMSGHCIRRHRQWLVAGITLPEPGVPDLAGQGESLDSGVLVTMPRNGQVVGSLLSNGKEAGSKQLLASVDGQWSLRRDVALEPFALPGRKGRKTLKKWLNELSVPAWLRARLPVLHQGHQMIAIPGVLVADGFQVAQGEQGWLLEWHID